MENGCKELPGTQSLGRHSARGSCGAGAGSFSVWHANLSREVIDLKSQPGLRDVMTIKIGTGVALEIWSVIACHVDSVSAERPPSYRTSLRPYVIEMRRQNDCMMVGNILVPIPR